MGCIIISASCEPHPPFVQVPATPTSSNASVDSVLMQHWLAMDIITALMGVMRVTAHVS